MNFQRFSSICGILGCTFILLAVVISILGFVGKEHEGYSLTNHFISELGDPRYNGYAWVFNWGLMLSSILLTLFAIGFAGLFDGWRRVVIGILALTTSISCFLVGAFPVDNLRPHLLVAMVFFHSALLLVFFKTTVTAFFKRALLPKWTIIPGLLTAISFAAFVISPSDLIREWMRDPAHFVRPAIWTQCILEWACFYSIILWLLIVSVIVLRRAKA